MPSSSETDWQANLRYRLGVFWGLLTGYKPAIVITNIINHLYKVRCIAKASKGKTDISCVIIEAPDVRIFCVRRERALFFLKFGLYTDESRPRYQSHRDPGADDTREKAARFMHISRSSSCLID